MTWVINLIIYHHSENIFLNLTFSEKKYNQIYQNFVNLISKSFPLRGSSTWYGRQEFSGSNSRCEGLTLDLGSQANLINFVSHLWHGRCRHSSSLYFSTELCEFLVSHLLCGWFLLFFCKFFITLFQWSRQLLSRFLNLFAFCALYLSLRLGTYPFTMKTPGWSVNCSFHCGLFPWS